MNSHPAYLLPLLITTALFAAQGKADRLMDEHYRMNFKGWKGVVFICGYDKNDLFLHKLCQRAKTDITAIGAAYAIPLKIIADNDYEAAVISEYHDQYLTLEYTLSATQQIDQYDIMGVHGELLYSISFSQAVEQANGKPSKSTMPRSGDLEVWSRTVTATGKANDLVNAFSDAIKPLLEKALKTFLQYRGRPRKNTPIPLGEDILQG